MVFPRSDKTVASIYSALLGEIGWQNVVDDVVSVADVDMATLFYHDAPANRGALMLTSGIPDAVQRDYSEHFAPLNPWMARIEETPIGIGTVGEQLVARESFVRSEYYNDFFRRHEQETSVGVTVRNDDGCFFMLSVLSGDTDFGRNRRRAGFLTRLAPHLRRASDFYRNHSPGFSFDRLTDRLSDAAGIGAVVVNHAARVIHASPGGARSLADGDVLAAGATGLVSFSDPMAQSVFEHALRGSYSDILTRTVMSGNTEVTFIRVAEDHGSSIFLGGTLAILLMDRGASEKATEEKIALQYGLTRAERRVFAGIASGLSLSEVAASAGVARETVRSQLKAIYGKTGTNRQSALVRLFADMTDSNGRHAGSRKG